MSPLAGLAFVQTSPNGTAGEETKSADITRASLLGCRNQILNTHTHTQTYAYTSTCKCTHKCESKHTRTQTHKYTHACTHTHTHALAYLHIQHQRRNKLQNVAYLLSKVKRNGSVIFCMQHQCGTLNMRQTGTTFKIPHLSKSITAVSQSYVNTQHQSLTPASGHQVDAQAKNTTRKTGGKSIKVSAECRTVWVQRSALLGSQS